MKINSILTLSVAASVIVACGVKKTTETGQNLGYETIDEEHMNKSVKPQDDFFEFANGTWCKENPVPDSESRWGSFNELDKANKEKLLVILKNAAKNNSEKGSQNQLLGDYYSSFVDMDSRNKRGMGPIMTELKLVKVLESKERIPELIAKLHNDQIFPMFYFGVSQDMKNVNGHVATLYQGGIGLPNRDYYFNEDKRDILKKYEEHIAKLFQLMGYSEDRTPEIASDIVNIETKLAYAMMTPSEARIPENTYNKMPTSGAMSSFGLFSFERYLQSIDMPQFDEIVVGQPKFIDNFAEVFHEFSLEQWKEYISWTIINHYAGHLNQDFVEANFNFYGTVLSGKKEMKSIDDRAIDEITGMNFGELLGKAFVDNHFSETAQKRVNEMVDNLLIVFGERINELTWMSKTTKKEALVKLNSIGRKLGFPSKWEDFSSLQFSANDYCSNYRAANQMERLKNLEKISKLVDKDEWAMPAHLVNAYYHPLLNEIAFPAGIMQPPFFSDTYEDAVNYGRIGMVIGHEFTHGFDDMGSKFAADGSFTNWWTDEDRKLFEQKTGILGETFSHFCPIEGQCVNPELTMGENIADLGGLTLAYHAYAKTREYKSELKRNGFSPSQRFFIAYAQLWKINYTTEELKNRLANDPHSPGMFRVNGPLKNCPEFFEAFDVKEGDLMRNQKSKVANIW